MINDIELEEIKKRDENTLQTPEPVQDSDPENDQSVSIWAYASAAL